MPNRSVDHFENRIDEFFKSPEGITDALDSQQPTDEQSRLLAAVYQAFHQYTYDNRGHATLTVFGHESKWNNRTHAELVNQIRAEIARVDNRTLPNNSVEITIQRIVALMEYGLLRMKCNPNGNFVNLCKAIVNKTQNHKGWYFSEQFRDTLATGMKEENPNDYVNHISNPL